MASSAPGRCGLEHLQDISQTCHEVADAVGIEWKNVARHLGFRGPHIDGIERAHGGDTKSCCLHVLDDWRHKHPDLNGRATLHHLQDVLIRAGLRELAEEIESDDVTFAEEDEQTKHLTTHNTDSEKHKGVRQSFCNIAEEVGTEWKNLARQLGYGELQISGIERQHDRNTRECCIHALDRWKLKHGRQATMDALREALIKAELVAIAEEIEDCSPPDADSVRRQNNHQVLPLFKRMPRRGATGNKQLEQTCQELVGCMESLKERGMWRKYDDLFGQASEMFGDNPDVFVRILLQDISAAYYRGNLESGHRTVSLVHNVILRTQNPQRHQAQAMYLKSALLRKEQKCREAESATVLARQALPHLELGMETGQIWYNVGALVMEVIRNKPDDSSDLPSLYKELVMAFQCAIDNYRAAGLDGASLRNKVSRVHIKLAMALLQFWSVTSTESTGGSQTDRFALKKAESSLLEVENHLWDGLSERMKCIWHVAKSELLSQKGSVQRAIEVGEQAMTMAKEKGIINVDSEVQISITKIEHLRKVKSSEVQQSKPAEDILTELARMTISEEDEEQPVVKNVVRKTCKRKKAKGGEHEKLSAPKGVASRAWRPRLTPYRVMRTGLYVITSFIIVAILCLWVTGYPTCYIYRVPLSGSVEDVQWDVF